MFNTNLKLVLCKKIIYKNLLKKIKPGQKILIILLFKGVNKKLRVTSYTGVISQFSKNNFKSVLFLHQSIFKYRFVFRLNVNSLNLFNFKLLL
jgi:hypothetical protein